MGMSADPTRVASSMKRVSFGMKGRGARGPSGAVSEDARRWRARVADERILQRRRRAAEADHHRHLSVLDERAAVDAHHAAGARLDAIADAVVVGIRTADERARDVRARYGAA